MVLTSLCIAATKVYQHLRPNDHQLPPVQPRQHDGHDLVHADSTVNDLQETSSSAESSNARIAFKGSTMTTSGRKATTGTFNNHASPIQSTPLTELASVTPPPPPMTRQYAFYKSIHHERSLLPTGLDKMLSNEQDTKKDEDSSSTQVINKNENQGQHESIHSSSTALRYRAKKPWFIPSSAAYKRNNTRFTTRTSESHHSRRGIMLSSRMKKASNDNTTSTLSNEASQDFSITSSPLAASQTTVPMTRQYAFCESASPTHTTQNQGERTQRLSSPELMPPPPPRLPRYTTRPLLRRQNAFTDNLDNTMLASKRKRHLIDENTPPKHRNVKQRLDTEDM
ncbi:hypothetical protein K492DRAFT_175388 [Lichtheimia hyalospora FSU 10163]|nr:hypothetical protein K492DRAFT_175388 [Lichtheimia hyalospora FSU 10163]